MAASQGQDVGEEEDGRVGKRPFLSKLDDCGQWLGKQHRPHGGKPTGNAAEVWKAGVRLPEVVSRKDRSCTRASLAQSAEVRVPPTQRLK